MNARAPLVLILSPERSGSTLLSVLLGAHSTILAPPELHLFRFPDYERWSLGYPPALTSLASLAGMLGWPDDPASLEARFAGRTVDSIYEELLVGAGPGRILIDKTPGNAHALESLERAERFHPLYVWLVRHPLGVALSRIERHREKRRARKAPFERLKLPFYLALSWWRHRTGRELQETLDRWTVTHERIESFLGAIEPTRWAIVHYEDLVRDPAHEIARLCRLLGVTMEPAMLDPSRHLPRGLQWGIGDEKIRTRERIDPSPADRWRGRFAEASLDPRTARLWERLRSRAEGQRT